MQPDTDRQTDNVSTAVAKLLIEYYAYAALDAGRTSSQKKKKKKKMIKAMARREKKV